MVEELLYYLSMCKLRQAPMGVLDLQTETLSWLPVLTMPEPLADAVTRTQPAGSAGSAVVKMYVTLQAAQL